MDIEQVKKASDLIKEIASTDHLISAYREAETIYVGIGRSIYGYGNQVQLTTSEIADQIVAVLTRRVAAMKAELADLGVEP